MTSNELLQDFPFRYVSDPDRIIYLNSVATGLLEMFYLCVKTGESAVLLTWPTSVENIAMLHALAALQHIVIESKEESKPDPLRLCSYFWPWKQNIEKMQKRILVDRTQFVKCNNQLVISYYLMGKTDGVDYAFHMALNCIKDLNPGATVRHTQGHHSILSNHPELVHPTLFEITPQAVFQGGKARHLPLAKDGFLRRSKKYVMTCPSLLDDRLFKIESSPCFMLGIPITCEIRELCRGDLFFRRRPNIVLLDLNSVYSRIGKNWQKQVVEFLSALVIAFSENEKGIPPVFALTEDPVVFNNLSFKLLADYEKKRLHKRHVFRYSFLNVAHSLFDHKINLDVNCVVPSVMVVSYAEGMADLFQTGQDLRNKVRDLGSEDLAEQIDILNQTIRYVVNMPGGFDDYMDFLQEYCDGTGHDIQSVAIRPWEKWIETKKLVEEGNAGALRVDAETYLKNTQSVIDGLKRSTPLQSRLEVLYNKLLAKSERSHVLVFPDKRMKAFAEWMISNRLKSASTLIGDDETKIVLLENRQALDLLTSLLNKFENIYFVLPQKKYLAKMLAQKEMPSVLTFVCDGGTVISLLRYVDMLEKVPGLEIIKPRLAAIHDALKQAADGHVSLLGELDEVESMVNTLIYNLRELEPDRYQGHPIVIVTEEGARIAAYEGSDILRYQDENDLQPFSKVTVSKLDGGDQFFVITPEFLDAASDKINITAMASDSLRNYHTTVGEKVRAISEWSLKGKAEVIQRRMKSDVRGADIGEGEKVVNIIRWINVEGLLKIPRELVRPHAPKIRRVFNLFMSALGVSEGEIDWYWVAAIQSTRKARIRAGLDRNRIFYRLLLDPASVEQFFHGDRTDLRNLIDIACRNVFTVSHILKEHDDEPPEH